MNIDNRCFAVVGAVVWQQTLICHLSQQRIHFGRFCCSYTAGVGKAVRVDHGCGVLRGGGGGKPANQKGASCEASPEHNRYVARQTTWIPVLILVENAACGLILMIGTTSQKRE
jgi:hypothetical protein